VGLLDLFEGRQELIFRAAIGPSRDAQMDIVL
jgi:hypothetical protein